ncbi:MAG: site-2 protease family protein [Oscillospiraceae bacterium]|nr:site-2 protease family protein [Oscillospiraceae bacterium]
MVTALVSIAMFLVMVSLHEFGHFIVAKLMNFKIDEFSIGMGPAVFKRKKGETQYSVRALPLGGYCKFDGEDEADNTDPRAFTNQKPWKRLLVLLAGGIFNIILGFVLFLIIVPSVSPVSTNIIDTVVEHSYIEQSGLMPGDKIVEINGKHVGFYNDITLYTQNFKKDEEAEITVKRNGEKMKFSFKPTEQIVEQIYGENGVQINSTINGHTTGDFISYSEDVPKNDSLVGETQTATRYIIGFTPVRKDINIFNIWEEALNETRFVVKLVYQSFWQMITGKIGVEEMSGPVGIVSEVNNAVNSGSRSWLYVLNLIALLTINLGIFNLLPIPALDGGRILFVLIEMVRRKQIPPDKEGIVHGIGLMLLFLFIIFISFNDVMRLIK